MAKGNCLVVGAGVNGLSTAIRLLEDNWNVVIWSANFSPNTTSDVAAALWYPFLSAPVEKTDLWGAKTYEILKNLSARPETGIEMVQTFEYFREPQENPSWINTVENFEKITDDLPGDYVECFSFITSIIEMPVYLRWIYDEYEKLGGKMQQKEITNFSEISDAFDLVVNCTGLDSGKLLDDKEVYPIRGQVLRVKSDIKEMHLDQQIPTLAYIVPRSNDMILGGVAQKDNWDISSKSEDSEFILKKCSEILPDLADIEIIDELVGLRPGRTSVRLDKEIISGRPLIHNYGHGGSGVTLSWGCADSVVELANE